MPATRDEIVDRYARYLGRVPSEDEIQAQMGNPNGIAGVGATIADSPEYKALVEQRGLNQGGTALSGFNENPRDAMIARDKDSWYAALLQDARSLGFANPEQAAQEELQGVINAVSYAQNAGKDPAEFLNEARARLRARGANNVGAPALPSGGGGGTPGASGSGGGGFPTPSRTTFPTPERPSVYSSAFKASTVTAPPEVGREQRDRIITAILDRPETMDQRAQDALFEQQKELANATAQANRARLAQAVLSGGFVQGGGRDLAGQAMVDESLANSLLGARRDVAVKAAETNRRDQLAALEMQQAISNGDHARALEIFKANEASRVQEAEFLQQAAALNAANQNAYNNIMLQTALGASGADLDYFTFLEKQRQFEADLAARYFALFQAGTR